MDDVTLIKLDIFARYAVYALSTTWYLKENNLSKRVEQMLLNVTPAIMRTSFVGSRQERQ